MILFTTKQKKIDYRPDRKTDLSSVCTAEAVTVQVFEIASKLPLVERDCSVVFGGLAAKVDMSC